MQKDIWKPVKGFEAKYEVSCNGDIRRKERTYEDSLGRLRHDESMILKPLTDFKGYSIISLCLNNKPVWKRVHRLVAEAFLDDWDPNLTVNHKDGNKQNNCIDNLEMMTQGENVQHYWSAECLEKSRQLTREKMKIGRMNR